ncbi:MAG: isoaspartyl peptidase/L-asparaginase [Planctomycetia bacterium]|nr:isoaspartyl peptidase/L-asparaginase [Planctomycetia bacterium]
MPPTRTMLVVHGGCGRRPAKIPEGRQEALERAVREGLRGRTALDMAERAARCLEDSPFFNAGTGSVLTLEGRVEMDAAVMTGDFRAGAVGGITGVRNPVSVARAVMEQTDHHLLVGGGATRFARCAGFGRYDPRTPERKKRWKELVAKLRAGGSPSEDRYWTRTRPWLERYLPREERGHHSTIGAVARDAKGRVAVATSTGGIWLKLPGRVGDSPILGGGTYACPDGAVSATGHGEGILRIGLAKVACDLMKTHPCQQALDRAIAFARRNGVEAGLIGVDAEGRPGEATCAEWMPTARA